MTHFLSVIFSSVGLYAVSIFMLNLVWTAYKKSRTQMLPIPAITWILYAIKYSTGIPLGGILSIHHAVWVVCALGMLACITKRLTEILITILITASIYVFVPTQITPHISLYGIMWMVGANAFLIQKITLIRKRSFAGLSLLSMSGFGLMHVCAICFFLERGDIVTTIAHTMYSIGHIVLLCFMLKYRD